MIPFRLSMNDMYAKDISKKVRTNLLQMKKDGKFCGSVPAYGYMRHPLDKHQLIPDPSTAPTVKKIFDLYVNAKTMHEKNIGVKEPVVDKQELLKNMDIFYNRFWTQQFKRSCMPDGVKVGSVSLSPRGDWRMASDACQGIWLDELKDLKEKYCK